MLFQNTDLPKTGNFTKKLRFPVLIFLLKTANRQDFYALSKYGLAQNRQFYKEASLPGLRAINSYGFAGDYTDLKIFTY